jgi:excisionase family DNA binding protein
LRIAQVAKQLGVSADLLRRLERARVLPLARRDRSGHRRFTETEVEQLRKILYPSPDDRPKAAAASTVSATTEVPSANSR